jgi:hypothetical protein
MSIGPDLTHSVASTDKFVAMHSGNSRLATWQAAILGPEGTPMRRREFIMLLGGAVAARRAGAAAGDAGDRVSHARIGRVVVVPCGR